jgi:tetratricopeptide (TPR) repeat protein
VNPKLLAAGAFILAAAMFVGGALLPLRAERSGAGSAPPAVEAADAVSPAGATTTARWTDALIARIDDNPHDSKLHAQLGLLYLQQAGNQADPSRLPLADRVLRRSLELQPQDNLEAFIGMASLANARHDFSHSLRWSRRAIETNPHNAAGYGLLGDALFELGRVRAADSAYQKMVDVRPDVASYVRASYALQYHQNIPAAVAAMRLALQAAGPSGETAAWVRHQMGDIYAGLRDHQKAARQNRIGIAIAPGYVPPKVGLAESYIAMGRPEEAVEIMETAADKLPSLEYMITLADLYQATGKTSEAERQYREVATRLKEYRRRGVLPDADFIVFYADHGLRPTAALREALVTYRNRPTAKTADALAWMLHTVGRDRRAWGYAREAIDARGRDSGMLFHAGMIAISRNDDETALRLMRRALELDPNFSLVQAPIARRIARSR